MHLKYETTNALNAFRSFLILHYGLPAPYSNRQYSWNSILITESCTNAGGGQIHQQDQPHSHFLSSTPPVLLFTFTPTWATLSFSFKPVYELVSAEVTSSYDSVLPAGLKICVTPLVKMVI